MSQKIRDVCLEEVRLELGLKGGQGGEEHSRQGNGICKGIDSQKNMAYQGRVNC